MRRFPGGVVVKKPPTSAEDMRQFQFLSGGGHDNPLQYSCLENPIARGAWQAIVHRVTKNGT